MNTHNQPDHGQARSLLTLVRCIGLQVIAGLIATTVWSLDPNSMPMWRWILGWTALVSVVELSVNPGK